MPAADVGVCTEQIRLVKIRGVATALGTMGNVAQVSVAVDAPSNAWIGPCQSTYPFISPRILTGNRKIKYTVFCCSIHTYVLLLLSTPVAKRKGTV